MGRVWVSGHLAVVVGARTPRPWDSVVAEVLARLLTEGLGLGLGLRSRSGLGLGLRLGVGQGQGVG